MARKFIAGILAGTVVSGMGLGAASLMSPLPGETAPQAGRAEVPAGSKFNGAREDGDVTLPAPEESTEVGAAPKIESASPDDLSSLQSADTAPAAEPSADTSEMSLAAPDVSEEGAGMAGEVENPVLPSPQAVAPQPPKTDSDLSISTDPAQPAPPETEDQSTGFASEDSAGFPSSELADAATAPAGAEAGEDTSEASDAAMAEVSAKEIPETSANETSDSERDEVEHVLTEEPKAPQAPEVSEGAEEPSKTVGNLAENVVTNRLPSIGGDQAEEEAGETEQLPELSPAEDLPAIQAHAAEFDNPEGKPMVSIVLLDNGRSPIGLEALAAFPYPLSFAVDPSSDGAAQAMDRYRAAGFEVLIVTDLPQGASATDTEIAMQTLFTELPQAVAVMEGTGTGLQSSREAAEQLAPILKETGHGLLMFSNGLNTASKLIAREGVPTTTIFRDFDGEDQSATVIRRFLDQGAFKARSQEGGVIMLGRLRAETVSALLIWGLQDRVSQVALAPVSAVLMAGQDDAVTQQ